MDKILEAKTVGEFLSSYIAADNVTKIGEEEWFMYDLGSIFQCQDFSEDLIADLDIVGNYEDFKEYLAKVQDEPITNVHTLNHGQYVCFTRVCDGMSFSFYYLTEE